MSIELQNAIASDEDIQDAEAIRDEENHEVRPVMDASKAFDNAEEVIEEPEDKPNF
jgi:hypothetical protein